MNKRLTREELGKQLSQSYHEIGKLYAENKAALIKLERERAEGYRDAIGDVIELIRDVFGKNNDRNI